MIDFIPAASLGLLLVFWFSWQASRRSSIYRAAVVVLSLSFAYWYFLPALNVLAIGFETNQIEARQETLERAYLWCCLYFALALGMLGFVASTLRFPRPDMDHSRRLGLDDLSIRRTQTLGLVSVLSAAGLLASRFGSDGTELMLRILTGETSARANMEYYNVSSSILSSLDGLWEIMNITICTLLLCICAIIRNSLGQTRLLAIAGLLVMFMASGSRSMIVYALVAVLTAVAARASAIPRGPAAAKAVRKRLSWARLAMSLMVAAGLVGAGLSFGSRFANYEFGMTSAILGMAFNHNDMLRELAIVLERLPLYRHVGFFDFALTPFTFLLPRFLGFDKAIPEHLVLYNLDRMGIDIRVDPGNYFPGIVADFMAVFGGTGGALAFALFVAAVVMATAWLGSLLRDPRWGIAVTVSCMALLFVSFRNIPGSFALSAVIAASLAWLLTPRPGSKTSAPHRLHEPR